jgi:hypothetical protein
MENKMERLRTDKELSDYVIDHIETDLRANKKLNGVDFSFFLSSFLKVYTSHVIFCSADLKSRNHLNLLASLGMYGVADELKTKLNKPVRFSESGKAGLAILEIRDRSEIDRIDEYADTLGYKAPPKFQEINIDAMMFITRQ